MSGASDGLNEFDGIDAATPDGAAELQTFETHAAAERQLGVLADRLMRLGVQLDVFGAANDSWGVTIRKLRMLHALGGRQLIAVAGSQGVGKTTAVCNLYPRG